MKKVKLLPIFCLLALVVALFAAVTAIFAGNRVTAQAASYTFEMQRYQVTFDVASDLKVKVEERTEIKYTGTDSTGYVHLIPVNSGEKVRNLDVYELSENGEHNSVKYDVGNGGAQVKVDIGDTSKKYNTIHTYVLTYDYIFNTKMFGDDELIINAVGGGWQCHILRADIKIILPEGYIDGSTQMFEGRGSQENIEEFSVSTVDGRTVVNATRYDLAPETPVTLSFKFEAGTFSDHFEMAPYWFIIAAAAVLIAAVLLKIFVFNKSKIVPVVTSEPPKEMDPLLMGKLIDNKVNPEDITSLIFYWADKGYVKINMEDEDDPVILREVAALPASLPDYQHLMFERLFEKNYEMKPSKMGARFAASVTAIKKRVDAHATGLHSTFSMGISILIAVLGGLMIAIAPLILGLTQINRTFVFITPFLMLVPALVVYALSESVWYNRMKLKKSKLILMIAGIAVLAAAFSLIYIFFIPDYIIGKLAKSLLCLVGFGTVMFAVCIVSHTQKYNDELREILGFKQFITTVEKPQLEAMLEENPDFYYHVLPYAQVLGVSDKWEDKFKDLTIEPPQWAIHPAGTIIQFSIINSMIRSSSLKMASSMITRAASAAASSTRSGFGGGGHHGGGGFGGSGGYGR